MVCPECQSEEIGASGVCLVCGHMISGKNASPESGQDDSEMQAASGGTETDHPEGIQEPAQEDDQPQWRRDLSQRLQAIKEKREAKEAAALSRRSQNMEKEPSISSAYSRAGRQQIMTPATFLEGVPAPRQVQKPRGPIPRQKTLEPLNHESPAAKQTVSAGEAKDIRALIDSAVDKKNSRSDKSGFNAAFLGNDPDLSSDNEGKLILLSRTLSGLVDLIIVLVCSGGCIIAADFFSGIIELDAVSYLAFSILFLLIYFFYSIFFLTAASQTIGMMITDLRLINSGDKRPAFRQLLRRCGAYLISLFGLGFGLIWSLFDRENLCFHDRVSGTQIVRS